MRGATCFLDIIGKVLSNSSLNGVFVYVENFVDLQGLVGRVLQPYVIQDNRHEAVGGDGCTMLYADSALSRFL